MRTTRNTIKEKAPRASKAPARNVLREESLSGKGVRPYDIFVGTWTGVANVFTEKGEFSGYSASRIDIHWKSKNILSYAQFIVDIPTLHGHLERLRSSRGQGQLLEQLPISVARFDLKVDGKAANGENKQYTIQGIESMPGNYLFVLRYKSSDMVLTNNQYFLNANQRNIVGPEFIEGEVRYVNVQTFDRVAF